MPLKKFKPVTPGTRFRSVTSGEEITRKGPERSPDRVPLRYRGA